MTRGRNFHAAAALVSWLAALAVMLLRVIGLAAGVPPAALAPVTAVLAAAGVAAAVAALAGVRSHGTEGILLPAVAGLLLGLLVVVTSLRILMLI
jgi:hypothetical protein